MYYNLRLRRGERLVQSKFYQGDKKKEKDYFAIINSREDGYSIVVDYSTKYRNEAIDYFEEEARLANGKVAYIGFYGE